MTKMQADFPIVSLIPQCHRPTNAPYGLVILLTIIPLSDAAKD